jgi:phosphoglycolate phosphatase-like HAD superfamily hydrolase
VVDQHLEKENQSPYLYFDLDGPILDVSEKFHRIYSDLVTDLGGLPLPKDDYWSRKKSRQADGKILEDSRLSNSLEKEFRHRRASLIETENYWRFDHVWPEVRDAIAGSPHCGKLVLVTLRNNRPQLESQLKHLGIDRWFRKVLSESGDAAGPDRHDVKVLLVERTFGKPQSGWFVGDTETDLRAGKKLGLRQVAVAFGIRDAIILAKENPDLLLDQPSHLANWITQSSGSPAA